MRVVCKNCQKAYNLDDNRIPLEGVKVKCPRCLKVFLVTPATTATDVEKTSWLPPLPGLGAPAADTRKSSPMLKGQEQTGSTPLSQATLKPAPVAEPARSTAVKPKEKDPWQDEEHELFNGLDSEEPPPQEEPPTSDLPEQDLAPEAAEHADMEDAFSTEETHIIAAAKPREFKADPSPDPFGVYRRTPRRTPDPLPDPDADSYKTTVQGLPSSRGFEDQFGGKTNVSPDPFAPQENDPFSRPAAENPLERPTKDPFGLSVPAGQLSRQPQHFRAEPQILPEAPLPFAPKAEAEDPFFDQQAFKDLEKDELPAAKPAQPATMPPPKEKPSAPPPPSRFIDEQPEMKGRDIKRKIKGGSSRTARLAKIVGILLLITIGRELYDRRDALLALLGAKEQPAAENEGNTADQDSVAATTSEEYLEGRYLFLFNTAAAFKMADYRFMKGMTKFAQSMEFKCADAENKLVWGQVTENDNLVRAGKKILDRIPENKKTAACMRAEVLYFYGKGDPAFLAKSAELLDRYLRLTAAERADFHHIAGMIAEKEGDAQKAKRNYIRALDEDGQFLKSLRALAAIEQRQNNEAEVKKYQALITQIETEYGTKYPELASQASETAPVAQAQTEQEKTANTAAAPAEDVNAIDSPTPEQQPAPAEPAPKAAPKAVKKDHRPAPIEPKPKAETAEKPASSKRGGGKGPGKGAYEEGNKHFQSGNFTLAKQAYEKAVAAEPKNPLYHCKLAEALNRSYMPDAAIHELEQALQLDPNFALAHKIIGYSYADLGAKEKAGEHLQKYLSLSPNARDADEVNAYLNELSSSN